jgi:hypothetical protein
VLVEDFEIELIGPPVAVGRAAAGGVEERALGFSCHDVFLLG